MQLIAFEIVSFAASVLLPDEIFFPQTSRLRGGSSAEDSEDHRAIQGAGTGKGGMGVEVGTGIGLRQG